MQCGQMGLRPIYVYETSSKRAEAGSEVILVNDGKLAEALTRQCRVRSFLENDDMYYGPPSSNDAAIDTLNNLRASGASYLIFVWPVFWWIDHFPGFLAHLNHHHEKHFTRRECRNLYTL